MSGSMILGRCLMAVGTGLVVLTVGCETAKTAPPEQVAAAESRLMSPYQQKRAVMSDELTIDISANFYSEVGRPAVQVELHELTSTVEDGAQLHRWTSKGGLQSPLTFTIGKTRFVALQAATLRVREGGEYALNATAAGKVTVSEAGKLLDCREVRIAEGMFSQQ